MNLPAYEAPQHWLRKFGGQVHKWQATDSEEVFLSNYNNPNQRTRLQENGWLDLTDEISYRHNKLGFRDDDFDDRTCGIALGCSYTQGIGLLEKHTWPRVLSNDIGIHIWNLGVGGTSIDTCYRFLDFFIRLNPKFVALLAPPRIRFELCTNSIRDYLTVMPWMGMQQGKPSNYIKYHGEIDETIRNYYMHETFIHMNFKKSFRALQQICVENNVPFIALTSDDDIEKVDLARDLLHPGVKSQKLLADKFAILLREKNICF